MIEYEKKVPDYTKELPQVIAVYCWKMNTAEDNIKYAVFYDRNNRMYRTGSASIRFKEGNYYAIRPKHIKLKQSHAGKLYIALHGIHIVGKLTKQEYYDYEEEVVETLRSAGEVIRWIDINNDFTIKDAIILEVMYLREHDLWKYCIQTLDDEKKELIIMETDIVDEEPVLLVEA